MTNSSSINIIQPLNRFDSTIKVKSTLVGTAVKGVLGSLATGAVVGTMIYGAFRLLRHIGWIEASNIHLGPYVAAIAGSQLMLKLVKLVYLCALELIGPREKYAALELTNEATRLDRFRIHTWKVIEKVEHIPKAIDKKVCSILGIHTNEEIKQKNIPFDELYAIEKIRFVFWKAVKEILTQTLTLGVGLAILSATGGFILGAKVLTVGGVAAIVGFGLLSAMTSKIDKLWRKAQDDKLADKLIEEHFANQHDLATVKTLDLRQLPELSNQMLPKLGLFNMGQHSNLCPLVLSKLIERCPQLTTIQLDEKSLFQVRGFEAHNINPKINVEIHPFASHSYASLWTDEAFAFLADGNAVVKDVETEAEKTYSVHRAVLAQLNALQLNPRFRDLLEPNPNKLTKAIFKISDALSKVKEKIQAKHPYQAYQSDCYLRFAYTGKIPLFMLNHVSSRLARQISTSYADCKFIVGNEENKKELHFHKVLLAIRSPALTKLFKENPQNEYRLDQYSHDLVYAVMHFIYKGEIDFKAIQDKKPLLALAQEWQVAGLKEKVESELQAELNLIRWQQENAAELVQVYAGLAEEFNLQELKEAIELKQSWMKAAQDEENCINEVNQINDKEELIKRLKQAEEQGYSRLAGVCLSKLKQLPFDLQFVCENDAIISVHQGIFAMKALKFKDYQDVNFKYDGLSVKIVKQVVDFIYEGKFTSKLGLSDYEEMAKIAYEWQIPSLMLHIDEKLRGLLQENLTLENLNQLKAIAVQAHLKIFVDYCDNVEKKIHRAESEEYCMDQIRKEKPSHERLAEHKAWAKEQGYRRIEGFCRFLLKKKRIYWVFV